jgi:4-hydroxybenzoate polyprenyltransferase
MLRYRVAAMAWMFMLLGAAAHGGLADLTPSYLWAALALASCYVAATTVNDVADRAIDAVNHPGDAGRPLVTGAARPQELMVLHALACVAALAAALPLGATGVALVAASLLLGEAYSAPPARFSYRTYLAPSVLGIAYVLVPYALGLVAAHADVSGEDVLFAGALYALFLARINLKDFRDRAGDALYGRPTLLLRFGKTATCAVSLLALAGGYALLLAAAPPSLVLRVLVTIFAVAIARQLFTLWRSPEGHDEQVAIGLGAKMGNGLLLLVLAWLVLDAQRATEVDKTLFVALLAAAYLGTYTALARSPGSVVIGYKG